MKNYCKPAGQVSGTCCCGLNTLSGPSTGRALAAAAISSLLKNSLGVSLNTSKPLVISVP